MWVGSSELFVPIIDFPKFLSRSFKFMVHSIREYDSLSSFTYPIVVLGMEICYDPFVTKESTLTTIESILDLKRAQELPREMRPTISMTLHAPDNTYRQLISDVQLERYTEHYFNNQLEKVVFTLSESEEEYEWSPKPIEVEEVFVVSDIAVEWKDKKPTLSQEQIERFISRLPKDILSFEIEQLKATYLDTDSSKT